MRIIENLTESYCEQLLKLYKQAWWATDRTLDEAKRCLNGSQLTIGVLNESGNLVAFSRVLTDYVFKAFIFDVIVDEHHRGNQLGDRLLSHIRTHPTLAGVKHIELYCRDDVLDFYVSRGFERQSNGFHFMRANGRTADFAGHSNPTSSE